MTAFNLAPDNSDDLEFSVEKFDFNSYQINSAKYGIKGLLRVGVVPFRIVMMKKKVNDKPQFYMQSLNVISFVNQGKFGKPDEVPFDLGEADNADTFELEESRDYEAINEPANTYFIIGTSPMYRIRSKSTIVKVEVIKGHYDYYGNPVFSVQVNTGISYSYMAKITEKAKS